MKDDTVAALTSDLSGSLTEDAEGDQDTNVDAGVAVFVKQLGRHPFMGGKPLLLADPHGGDWTEWPKALRFREFPAYFHRYRAAEMKAAGIRRVA